jgi:hypothetical protein
MKRPAAEADNAVRRFRRIGVSRARDLVAAR